MKNPAPASPADQAPCPCDLGTSRRLRLSDCCGRYHAGAQHLQAPDALALMRSRYSAYVLDRLDYLRATWDAAHCPADLTANEPGLRWLGLEIQEHRVIDADHQTVRFVARSKLGGRAHRLVETSRFERRDGRWFYVDGDVAGR
ncbi:YchJ family protein [Leptothrix sp. BB-4]